MGRRVGRITLFTINIEKDLGETEQFSAKSNKINNYNKTNEIFKHKHTSLALVVDTLPVVEVSSE